MLPRRATPAQRAQRSECVVGQLAGPDQIPQRIEDLSLRDWSGRRRQFAIERRSPEAEPLAQPFVDLDAGRRRVGCRQIPQRLAAGPVEDDAPIVAAQTPPPRPCHLAQRPELVQEPRLIAGDPRRQDVALQYRRRDRNAGQLIDHFRQPLERHVATRRRSMARSGRLALGRPAYGNRPHSLPRRQEPGQDDLLDRLNLAAQPGQRTAPQLA